VLDKNPSMYDAEIVGTYKDPNHIVHSHHLKSGDNEFLVIKNYGFGFHNKSYGYYGFPHEGVWEEIFSSDEEKYGGGGFNNKDRHDITHNNQNLALAPNSFIILKRIK
ncbi:alpha amylase C-terminal domain-containing protein, partial [bacterium]|nr:alpha amylase C-terminal domain-containing protein [bacterium]